MNIHSGWLALILFLSVLAPGGGGSGYGWGNPALAASSRPVARSEASDSDQEDARAYMHGIEAVKASDGGNWVFFSSSKYPPAGPNRRGNWTHDVYVSHWGSADARISPPRIFMRKPEAQEPVSVAQTTDGRIMVTVEDGWDTSYEVNQRYGVYDPALRPIARYPLNVAKGGHSGHVAAVGNHFVVFYSEGWKDEGGDDDLGTGNGVYAKVYDSGGKALRAIDIAPDRREWWPMIAASPTRALLVWQQFVPGQTYANLKMALLDPRTGAVTGQRVLHSRLQYYTYQTAYVPAIERFIVTGATVAGKGFAYLVDRRGRITARLPCMPPTVREAGITVNGAKVYTPSPDNRLLHLALTPSSILLTTVQSSPLNWSSIGNIGLMRDPSRIHWLSLTKTGIQETDFDVSDAKVPSAADRCQ